MQLRTLSFVCLLGMLLSCSLMKESNKVLGQQPKTTAVTPDTIKNTSADSGKPLKPKPYKDIISKNAITDSGLFHIHKVDERYFIEVPNALLGKEILVVNRIAKAAAGIRRGSFLGYGGDEIGEKIIVF